MEDCHEERGRRQLTPERQAELQKLSKQYQEEQTDSGFVDDMDDEGFSSIEKRLNEQESVKQNVLTDLEEKTSRLSLETQGSVTSSAVTELQRNQNSEDLRNQENLRSLVKNRERNQDGDTLLHVAIIHRNNAPHGLAEFAIHNAPEPAYLDLYNNLCQTAVHLAVITRESGILRTLIENGARIDIPDRNGNLPLHIACENGDIACVIEITRPFHDISFAESHPNTKYSLVKSLNSMNFCHGLTALHLAASNGHKNIVQFLVKMCGANVDAGDSTSGRTALHHAVEAGDVGMVTHLIHKCEANINAQTFTDCTPLHIAVGRGNQILTNFLIASGADPTIENYDGETPI